MSDPVLEALNKREQQLRDELERVLAAKRAYKNGPVQKPPKQDTVERQIDDSSEGSMQEDVYAQLPANGDIVTIDSMMDALSTAGKNYPRESVVAALSVLVTRKNRVKKHGRGKYSRSEATK